MKAMVLTAPGELVQDELARPTAGAGQVLVRVTHSGICGTDYKIFNGSIPVRYPRVMGHEMVGEVADPGDTTHLCPNGSLLGRDANGGFAEYLGAPASQVFKLPADIEIRHAPLIQVLTT